MVSAEPSSPYPGEEEIALRVLGEGKAKQWAALVPTLEWKTLEAHASSVCGWSMK